MKNLGCGILYSILMVIRALEDKSHDHLHDQGIWLHDNYKHEWSCWEVDTIKVDRFQFPIR